MLACIGVRLLQGCRGFLKARIFACKAHKMSARSERKLIDDQDELEYNITFPTLTGMEDDDVKEPVVYLLGWAGSTDKILAKYSAIYEQEGCITLRYTLPTDKMFILTPSSVDFLQDTSKTLLQLLEDYDLQQNPVMFHVFSNGGAMLYRWTADLFYAEKVSVIGVVMDSCPSRLDLTVGMKAIYFSKRPFGFFNYLWYLGRFIFNSLLLALSWDSRFDLYEPLKTSDKHLWPHMFLYSANDGVIPPDKVIEMAEARKCAGATFVRTHDFVTSAHVQHLKVHKDKYIDECGQFLDDCLSIHDGEELQEVQEKKSNASSVDPARKRPYSEYAPSTSGRKSSLRIRKTSRSETRI